MKWSIPAKTFFLGEYAAIFGAPAFVLTTTPCFELTLVDEPGLHGIHPDSPAGRLWAQRGPVDKGLQWYDPYHGRGGLGASSAQFLGAYYASCYHQHIAVSQDDMLEAYFQSASQGEGVRPSGYDLLAQSLHGCVYIHRQQAQLDTHAWPFRDLAFILLHTGQKLSTHLHLQALKTSLQIKPLEAIVASAKLAFESADSLRIIEAVNDYHHCLLHMNLVAPHSLQHIELLRAHADVLAIKGCGAMGADVLLLLVPANRLADFREYLDTMALAILATSENLHTNYK